MVSSIRAPRCSAASALVLGQARAVVLDHHHHLAQTRRPGGDPDPALRPFAGVLDQVAEDFLQVLPLAPEAQFVGRAPVDLDALGLEHPLQHHRQFVQHLGDGGALAQQLGAGGGAGAAQMVVDLRPSSPRSGCARCRAAMPGWSPASASMTDSGVFSAWARLPTWVRWRSTVS